MGCIAYNYNNKISAYQLKENISRINTASTNSHIKCMKKGAIQIELP